MGILDYHGIGNWSTHTYIYTGSVVSWYRYLGGSAAGWYPAIGRIVCHRWLVVYE